MGRRAIKWRRRPEDDTEMKKKLVTDYWDLMSRIWASLANFVDFCGRVMYIYRCVLLYLKWTYIFLYTRTWMAKGDIGGLFFFEYCYLYGIRRYYLGW